MNGGTIKEYTAPETGVYDSSNPLTCGDLIRISASGKREIKVIERTFDWENSSTFQIGQKDFGVAGTAKNPYSTEGYGVNDELYLLCGRAKRLSNNIMEVSYGAGLSEQFYLNGKNIVIVYPPYELSYYERGFVEIPLDLESMSGYLKPEYRCLAGN